MRLEVGQLIVEITQDQTWDDAWPSKAHIHAEA